ncbi:MAG: lipocalin family protein, partial [Opitutales bacterium]|nr:lipocalin family protein [Opitutales bacterium]
MRNQLRSPCNTRFTTHNDNPDPRAHPTPAVIGISVSAICSPGIPRYDQTMRNGKWLVIFGLLGFSGCVRLPDGIEPISGFEQERYLGKWYEIARLDHSFERGLHQVTAEYSMRKDGGIRVINRGWSSDTREWKEAEGRAYAVKGPETGFLKVSFFGPFYGSYVIFEMDLQDYQYAFVSGPNRSYLWLLARQPDPDKALIERF